MRYLTFLAFEYVDALVAGHGFVIRNCATVCELTICVRLACGNTTMPHSNDHFDLSYLLGSTKPETQKRRSEFHGVCSRQAASCARTFSALGSSICSRMVSACSAYWIA